jgi:hypothetical protein
MAIAREVAVGRIRRVCRITDAIICWIAIAKELTDRH